MISASGRTNCLVQIWERDATAAAAASGQSQSGEAQERGGGGRPVQAQPDVQRALSDLPAAAQLRQEAAAGGLRQEEAAVEVGEQQRRVEGEGG